MKKPLFNSFSSFGVQQEDYNELKPDIMEENLRGLQFYLTTATILFIFCLFAPLLVERDYSKALMFIAIAFVFFCELLVVKRIKRNPNRTPKQIGIMMHTALFTMLVAELYVGSISNTAGQATLFHAILIFSMCLFILPSKLLFILPIFAGAMLVVCDVFFKPRALLIKDLVNSIVSACIAIIVGIYTTRHYLNMLMGRRNERIQLAQLEESARQANVANNAKGSFMSRISHEIRTPLNAIIGYNSIARNDITQAKDDAARRNAEMKTLDCLTKSEIASRHLLNIINDVLDMSAIESGRIKVARERFDFKTLISSLTTLFYTQAKTKGIKFNVVFDTLTEEWYVGDQLRINQVLSNLLSNAIKFTADGEGVRLIIRQMPSDSDEITLMRFEVTDSGIGISKQSLQQIWEPFEQGEATITHRYGGTGLGLAITKSLVELMNGTISVSSMPEVGTTFTVELPFTRTYQPTTDESISFKKIRALVIDDDRSTCDYIRMLFHRAGARCDTVTGGLAGVEAFSEAISINDPYTVCLVDWQMPQCNGIETVKRIRSVEGPQIPIIILSSYDFSEIADRAQEYGVDRFIAKPLFQSALFDLLADISGIKTPITLLKSKKSDFEGKRVLLVEDNAMNMEIAYAILTSANFTVEKALNGEEAVEKFNNSPSDYYKAILMDIQMPKMNGYTATRTIRAGKHPDAKTIPIVAMTADAFSENVTEALESGMNAHVAKPINTAQLFTLLKELIDGTPVTEGK